MGRKRVYIAVTNDLYSDQRVHKIATSLNRVIGDVTLIGVRYFTSENVEREYSTKRLRLIFKGSFLFYLEYNIRLFFFLLFRKTDIIVANDLDTLLASYCVSKLKQKALVYDSHEYFTEVPELQGRRFVKSVWAFLEKKILPQVRYSYTVCESIANIYNEKYGISMRVVRNLPYYTLKDENAVEKEDVIIYQGAINVGRGIEEAVEAMRFVDGAKLWIVGDGDITDKVKALVKKNSLEEKVIFIGRVPFEKLSEYTQKAKIGLSLEEGDSMGLSYYYSLPNKLFDYIQARVPVLTTDLPEKRRILEGYKIGLLIDDLDPYKLAKEIQRLLEEQSVSYDFEKAAKELCWEKEEEVLMNLYDSIV